MNFAIWSDAADRERDEEDRRDLRAAEIAAARLVAAGLEQRSCEICGDDFRREIGGIERRCGSCRSLTCPECGAVADGVAALFPAGRGCIECWPI